MDFDREIDTKMAIMSEMDSDSGGSQESLESDYYMDNIQYSLKKTPPPINMTFKNMAIIRLISMSDKKYDFGDEEEYQQLQSVSSSEQSSQNGSNSDQTSYNGTLPSTTSLIEDKRGKARNSSQILALVPVYLPTLLRNEHRISRHFDTTVERKLL